MSVRICIVDYGVGNQRSVEKALQKVGVDAIISSQVDELEAADGLVLPGVGAFPSAIERIRSLGLDLVIERSAAAEKPILGACLGMQLLFDRSTEHGGAEGLGLIAGEVSALDPGGAKLPHIGWADVVWSAPCPLTAGFGEAASFYHVHSYVVAPARSEVVAGWSTYANRFPSVVAQGNIYGVQFHPEKSSANGLRMLANFSGICEEHAR